MKQELKIKSQNVLKNAENEQMLKYGMLEKRAVAAPERGRAKPHLQWWPDVHGCNIKSVCPRECFFLCACWCPRSLWQGFQDGVHLLSHCSQSKLKLVLQRERMEKWAVREGRSERGRQTAQTCRLAVPWCGPGRASGLWCAPARLRCRSPSLLRPMKDKQHLTFHLLPTPFSIRGPEQARIFKNNDSHNMRII